MSGLKIVAVLVICTQGLLLCEPIDTERLGFADIEECTRSLPALVADAQGADLAQVVMGRCRYQLDEGARRPLGAARAPSG